MVGAPENAVGQLRRGTVITFLGDGPVTLLNEKRWRRQGEDGFFMTWRSWNDVFSWTSGNDLLIFKNSVRTSMTCFRDFLEVLNSRT